MDSRIRQELEEKLLNLPIVQYAWMNMDEIEFSENVRYICRTECPRYGTSWSCPPAVGTVEECRKRCEVYSGAFIFTTMAEVNDAADLEETLATRSQHEEITREILRIFETFCYQQEENGKDAARRTLALSAESCAVCEKCAYPDAPCRHPERMLPCIESYGIVVPKLAEKAGIEFMAGMNVVTWFGIVLFTE